jgi:hypothetical protein
VPSVREQVEALIRDAGYRWRVVAVVLDMSAAQRVLGWQPRYSNVAMTCEAYDRYCRHWEAHAPRHSAVMRLLNALS